MRCRVQNPGAAFALLAVLCVGVSADADTAAAQSLWMARDGNPTLMLEVLQPSLEGFNSEVFSAAFFLSGRVAVSPRVSAVGEIPFARHRSLYQVFYAEELSNTTIGNPYVGLEFQLGSGPAFLEFGARPQLVADNENFATLTGRSSDLSRWEAFDDDAASILMAFNVREVTASKIAFRLRAGTSVVVGTSGDDIVYANYSFQIGYQGSKVRLGAAMTGRSQLTQSLGFSYDPLFDVFGHTNLGQRSTSQFELHTDFLSGHIRPGLDLHLPLDPMGDFVPVVLGANISWTR